MKIKIKVVSASILIAVLPLIVVTLLLGWVAINSATDALHEANSRQLVSIRDTKKVQIEDYFNTIASQVKTFSNDRMVIDAMRQFRNSFTWMGKEKAVNLSSTEMRNQLTEYYQTDFNTEYKRQNNGKGFATDKVLSQLDAESLALQYLYIKANPNPLGEKHKLDKANDGSHYSTLHNKYHPHIREYLEEFGYYDIFLADAKTGDIVYSVFKELDFSTSLIDGPYAKTGIGEAFRKANEATNSETVSLIDFAPYGPSYEGAASFMASPIYDGDEKVGILIFQMPVGRINDIMTSQQKWKDVGLGDSGETYLIGSDFKARSMSRFLIEDKAAYLKLMKEVGLSQGLVDEMRVKDTNVGLQRIQTPGTEKALKGERGLDIFPDYRGVNVLSAYTPLNIPGLNWVLMSEIDEEEAFRAEHQLSNKILMTSMTMFIVIALAAIGVGLVLSGRLVKPILHLNQVMREVEAQNDLTQRTQVSSKDELGEMSNAFNAMLTKFESLIQQVSGATVQIAASAEQLSATTQQTSDGINRQRIETEQVATAMHEMVATVQEVAGSANNAAGSATSAEEEVTAGRGVVLGTSDEISNLTNSLERTAGVIDHLSQDSAEIGNVLEVIRGVANQTNLLALNAAIEAARAGEQGRGFAVVADEVRTLALRTGSSTDEIQKIVEGLQSRAREAVSAVEQNREQAGTSIEQAEKARMSLETINSSVSLISDMNIQIASAAEEQSSVAEEINRSVNNISQVSEESAENSEQVAMSSNDLARLSEELKRLVSQFKV